MAEPLEVREPLMPSKSALPEMLAQCDCQSYDNHTRVEGEFADCR